MFNKTHNEKHPSLFLFKLYFNRQWHTVEDENSTQKRGVASKDRVGSVKQPDIPQLKPDPGGMHIPPTLRLWIVGLESWVDP